jgi:hypothetical protein
MEWIVDSVLNRAIIQAASRNINTRIFTCIINAFFALSGTVGSCHAFYTGKVTFSAHVAIAALSVIGNATPVCTTVTSYRTLEVVVFTLTVRAVPAVRAAVQIL